MYHNIKGFKIYLLTFFDIFAEPKQVLDMNQSELLDDIKSSDFQKCPKKFNDSRSN